MAYKITAPRWSSQHTIDVVWDHPRFGPIPYTVIDKSGETDMQAIWDGLMRGDYGPVLPA